MSNFVEDLKEVLNEKSMQISILGGVLFFILAQPAMYEFVSKTLKQIGSSIGYNLSLQGNNLIVLHSLVFVLLFSQIINYVLEPLFYNKM